MISSTWPAAGTVKNQASSVGSSSTPCGRPSAP
jgi:hypothetical protein